MNGMAGLLFLPLLVIVAWVPLSVLVGWVADRRGYSGPGWFALGLLLSPFLAGLLLICVMPRRPHAGSR
jgi:hypothetical protein